MALKIKKERVVIQKEDLEKICYNFYNNLYRAQRYQLENEEVKVRVLDSFPQKIFVNMNFRLKNPFPWKSYILLQSPWIRERPLAQMGWWWNFTPFVWDLNGDDFFKMIVIIIGEGCFPNDVGKALLLFCSRQGIEKT